MSTDITTSFVRQYESEVKHIYQRQGSKLRNTVRNKNNVKGESTTFQVIGAGTASTKARHAAVTPMNISHTAVTCTLADYYAGDFVDKLDEAKINHDERKAQAMSGAYALGRQTDALIIAAAETTSNTVPVAASGMTLPKVYTALETLGDNDSFDGGRKFCLVGYQQWTDLLQIKEFASADYVSADQLPFKEDGAQGKFWLGTLFMPHTGLTKTVNDRSCLWYNESALGHAIGCDVTADIWWSGEKAAHFVNHFMSQGSALIDTKGVVKIECLEV